MHYLLSLLSSSRHAWLGQWVSLCILLPLPISPALGQQHAAYSLPNTRVDTLHASTNGITYVLYVSLPRSYAQEATTYPVIYILDADYSFALAHNIVEHFVDRGNLPPMVLVGIAYEGASQDGRAYRLNRSRDYTPTHTLEGGYGPSFQQYSGGGPTFLRVIREEIAPHIESNYRARHDDRTFVGHSFGGLFGTFALFSTPPVFQRFIIVSPSLWYDEKIIFDLEQQRAQAPSPLKAAVFMSVGSYENQPHNGRAMVDDLHHMVRLLTSRNHPNLNITTYVFGRETHNSVFPAALTRGLRTVFAPGAYSRE